MSTTYEPFVACKFRKPVAKQTECIRVIDIQKKSRCVLPSDAKKIRAHIEFALKHNSEVVVSFKEITFVVDSYLSYALGWLCEGRTIKEIHEKVHLTDCPKELMDSIDFVFERCCMYYENPERYLSACSEYRKAMDELYEDD